MDPIHSLDPVVPPTPEPSNSQPAHLGGISRGLATLGLAVGLLAVGAVRRTGSLMSSVHGG